MNTTGKLMSYGYCQSLLLFQQFNEKPVIPAAEQEESEIPSYQNTVEENVLPETRQVIQTILPINPTTLRI